MPSMKVEMKAKSERQEIEQYLIETAMKLKEEYLNYPVVRDEPRKNAKIYRSQYNFKDYGELDVTVMDRKVDLDPRKIFY